MKKFLLASMVLACSIASMAADQEVLRVATDGTYPPFSELGEDGQMVGFDIDIAQALCDEMKVTCEFKRIEWNGLIPALKAGKIDAIIASMNANEERRKSVTFSAPYYGNPGIFVRAKGSDFELNADSMKGSVIGVLRSSIFDDYVTEEMKDWDVTIQRYSSQEEANLDIQSGRIDVLFADKIVLQNGFLDREEGKNFEAFGPELNDPKYFGEGISIAVRLDEQDLADRFTNAIQAIRANGEYQKVNDKYFTYDIYDVIANPPEQK